MSVSRKLGVWAAILAGGLVVLLAGSEIAVRLSGVADFPIYRSDPEIGYILAPNQHGTFLNQNHWLYNEKSQGAGPWKPNRANDLLLLGDSIVLGGNPIDQSRRLGPQLQALLPGWEVWPASAGSWGVPNEIVYLRRYPEVAAAVEEIVWVLNTGDLAEKSVWRTDLTHPRTHPWSALWYVFNKYYLLPRSKTGDPANLPPPPPQLLPETVQSLGGELRELVAQHPGIRLSFVLYPSKDEFAAARSGKRGFYDQFRGVLMEVASQNGIPVIEVELDSRWNLALYRDGIHPSAEGYAVLAKIIAEKLKQQGLP